MTAYNYSNISAQTTLAAGITPTSQVVSLTSAAGLPVSFPFTLIIDYGQANVEVVTATGLSGTNYAVTRGEDGTAAQSHNPGAVVVHGVAARDLKGPQDHMAASTGVHGVAGAVVGTTDAQTLSGKTINGTDNTLTVRDADVTALSASKLTGNFNGGSSFVATADATVPLTAKGTATATGNLLEAYKGAANQFAVSANGTATLAGGVAAGASLGVTRTTASGLMLTGQVTADAQSRFAAWADGTLKWGTGAAATDVSIARTAANTLGVTGALTVSATPTGATDVTTKAYVDARPVGSTVCTSTTRPTGAALFTGMEIRETDTGLSYWWTGTAWKRTDWEQAWGVVGGKRYMGAPPLATGVGATEGQINMDTGPVTLLPGRSYRWMARVFATSNANVVDYWILRLRRTNVTGAQVAEQVIRTDQNAFGITFEFQADHPDIGADPITDTWVLTCQRLTGGTSVINFARSGINSAYVLVEDKGPISRITAL